MSAGPGLNYQRRTLHRYGRLQTLGPDESRERPAPPKGLIARPLNGPPMERVKRSG